jgi:hypothetical protein
LKNETQATEISPLIERSVCSDTSRFLTIINEKENVVGRYPTVALAPSNQNPASGLPVFIRFFNTLAFAILSIFLVIPMWCQAQVSVVMQHNDIGRTGQNNSETTLTPATVNSSQFGLLFSQPVDGQVYAQPLYLPQLQIPGAGTHNALFVATENDSVYAFDADFNGAGDVDALWHASLLTSAYGAAAGATTVPSTSIADDIVPQYGITGTPVIDPVAGILYVVSFSYEGTSYVLRLHALSVTTGAEMLGGPVVIQAKANGTGNGSSGGVLSFDPRWENQRAGLLLLNGVVYIPFASHADNGDWHGWILAYKASTLAQISALCTSPNGVGSGFWMGGNGLAADVIDPVGHPYGRMFVSTGNGDYAASTPYTNSMDYGDSIVNLDLTNGVPTVQDEFTPFNQAALDTSDQDLGAGGIVVLPNQTGTYPHLLAQEGKAGTLYLVDRDQMNGYNSTDQVVQEIDSSVAGKGIWGGPVYWNNSLYTNESYNYLKAYSLANSELTPTSESPEKYNFPGPGLSTSSCLSTCGGGANPNAILWAVETDSYAVGGNAVLRAYNPANLATEYYNSNQVPARDSAGAATKFATPTVANGKVYVGTGGQLNVYGLLNEMPTIPAPVITPGTSTFTQPIQVTITDAVAGATIYYTANGTAPSTASTVYTGSFTVNSTQTITAIAVAPGYDWISPVSATFTSLDNTANPAFSPQGGTFSTLPIVTITDASTNASIYYTLDGSTPTTSSTLYTGPITLGGSKTIHAIAFAPNLSGSAIESQTYTTSSGVDLSLGFSQAQSIMTFNGTTGLDDSRLQLTNGYTADTGSAFITSPLNIQAFTTQFLFQLSNPQADGITFTIQADKPNVVGPYSEALGYATIPKSVAVKFDFYSDQGEGADSTGLYVNGVEPTIPALNLTNSGISLTSGDVMAANITYDGTNLEMTLIDQVTSATWSGVWQVNIPQIVGGNTAYVGFTGSTQILTASQKISTWVYTAATPGTRSGTATPVISPGSGSFAKTEIVTITDSTPKAVIYYTTDGTPPTTVSNVYSQPFAVSSSAKIQAMAVVWGGAVSGMTSATLAIASGVTTAVPAYSIAANGFSYGSLIMNGTSFVANTMPYNGTTRNTLSLQLTDGGETEAHSAFFANPVNVQSFTTDFDFKLTNAVADGFAFVIQNQGLNAVGSPGGGLGYGVETGVDNAAIGNSVAVKFDIHSNAGEGNDSTGVYVDGASPTTPATDLTNSGIVLSDGDQIHAHITYNGTNLTLTLSDATNGASVTETYAINIPATVGANTAYVGFTGGSGGSTAVQNVLDWTYAVVTPNVATAAPAIGPGTGTYTTPTVITLTDATQSAVIYYTTNGTTPTTASAVYSAPITVDASSTIEAIAQAPGDTLSGVTSATYTLQLPAVSYPSGFTAQGLTLNKGATINGTALEVTDGGANEARSAYYTTPVNIQAFSTAFDFQEVNAVADGFTFTIQNQGVTAVGGAGGGLGYGLEPGVVSPIINDSVAVKFDIHSNSGEGNDSTGVYVNGASPTLPATNLSNSGVILSSGHKIHALITYNGSTLALTLTDEVTNATVTESYQINIPATVDGDTAYVGFTGGTGGSSATQEILDWTYTVATSATIATAAPAFSLGSGTYATPTSVTVTDATAKAVIYYTTDGSIPTTASIAYGGPIAVSASGTIKAIAQAPGDSPSGVSTSNYTIQSPAVSYAPAVYTAQGLALGGATVNGTYLQLTDGGANEARSAYFTAPLNVQKFSTTFDFQLLNAVSDGFTFVIQNQGIGAVGGTGGGLGYGIEPGVTNSASIGKSVAVKFDIHSNSGEGNDSTGVYVDGASPTLPATNLTGTGIVLASGDKINALIIYNGTTLTLTLTDDATNATVTETYTVNIPATVGGDTAYVGFTGGTGGTSAIQNILDWSFSNSTTAYSKN